MKNNMIVLLGPTATGKTQIAALLSHAIGGEIISADSRQVYRGMDIGTGKDLGDYFVNGIQIPAHIVDIVEAGEKYSLFNYREDFGNAYNEITSRGKIPVVCGGSGMYIECALGLYDLKEVPENKVIRDVLSAKSNEELILLLKTLNKVHNTTDLLDRERLTRAVEIALVSSGYKTLNTETYNELLLRPEENDSLNNTRKKILQHQSPYENEPVSSYDKKPITDFIYGLLLPREEVRSRITNRLHKRLKEGLIEEVEGLHNNGVSYETLQYYGLEYKYIALYLEGKLIYDDMVSLLETAIHQFAKRQMTWFRRMERKGIAIKWLPSDPEVVISRIKSDLNIVGLLPL